MEKMIFVLTFSLALVSFGFSDDVEDKLLSSLYEVFQCENESEFYEYFSTFLKLDETTINDIQSGRNTSIGIPVPVAETFVSMFFSDGDSRKKYNEIRKEYLSTNDKAVLQKNKNFFYKKVASPEVLATLEKYWEGKNKRTGLSFDYEIKKERDSCIFIINWRPVDEFAPDELEIESIQFDNLTSDNQNQLRKGMIIKKGTNTFILKRINKRESTFMSIKFKGIGSELLWSTQLSNWYIPEENTLEGDWIIRETISDKAYMSIDWGSVFKVGVGVAFRKTAQEGIFKANLEQGYVERFRVTANKLYRIIGTELPPGENYESRGGNPRGKNGLREEPYGEYIVNGDLLFITIYRMCVVKLERDK